VFQHAVNTHSSCILYGSVHWSWMSVQCFFIGPDPTHDVIYTDPDRWTVLMAASCWHSYHKNITSKNSSGFTVHGVHSIVNCLYYANNCLTKKITKIRYVHKMGTGKCATRERLQIMYFSEFLQAQPNHALTLLYTVNPSFTDISELQQVVL